MSASLPKRDRRVIGVRSGRSESRVMRAGAAGATILVQATNSGVHLPFNRCALSLYQLHFLVFTQLMALINLVISIHYFCLSLAAIPGYFIPLPRNTAIVTSCVP